MERDLTSGSVFKNIIRFSLPYLLSYFLQTLYGMADLFIIGQYGTVADTTSVSIGSQVMHMITVMLVGLAMGTTVSIGQAIGAKNKKEAANDIGNSVTLFLIVSVALTVLLLLLVRPIVSVMSTPAEAVEGTVRYLIICFIGIPFITAYNIISSIFRGMGDSKSPMYFIAIACVFNIALDYLFMGAFQMGPAGAALGTTLAQTLSVVIALIAIFKRKFDVPVTKADLRLNRPTTGRILKIGAPIAFQDGLIQIAFIIITIIVNLRGLNDAAAVGIVEKMITFIFLVPSSMLSTVSALGAQNIGAQKPERAKETLRYAILISICYGILIGILMQFLAEPLISLFTDASTADGAEVVRLGGSYMRGYIWDCVFAGIHFSFSGYFSAIGKSGLSFMHNIISVACVRVPGVYITSKMFADTLFPMGLATAAGSFTSCIICIIAFTVITRKEKQQQTA